MKQYIGIIRDHSGSMTPFHKRAMLDYNAQIDVMQREAKSRDIDTLVSVVSCGIGRTNGLYLQREEVNTSVARLKPLTYYEASGNTPLYNSLNELLDILEAAPDAQDKDVAFLVMVITDGENTENHHLAAALGQRIKRLQATDKWTFTFRMPHGYANALARTLGIPVGNMLEWEQTERGFERATKQTVAAMSNYYGTRTMGQTMSSTFYADVANLSPRDVKNATEDITREVKTFKVVNGGEEIKPFVERFEGQMRVGGAFYQLSKPEPKVQSYKQVILRDRTNGKVYGGQGTRGLLGLFQFGDVKMAPGDQGRYDVFIQSTSVNRKLIAGTDVIYWPSVRY